MTKDEIRNKVVETITSQLGVTEAEVTDEAKFIEDLGADSLDTVELIMELEDEFDLEIPDEEAESITSVIKVIEYIESKLN